MSLKAPLYGGQNKKAFDRGAAAPRKDTGKSFMKRPHAGERRKKSYGGIGTEGN